MKITQKSKKDFHIYEVDGPIRAGMEYELAEQVEQVFEKEGTPKFIIDLKKVPFVNSATLGVFLNMHKRAESMKGRFSLSNLNKEVENLLEITKLNSILEIHKNLDEAIESYSD
jgi:anti-sigma B factor antagonist